jgi:hypothetical protein
MQGTVPSAHFPFVLLPSPYNSALYNQTEATWSIVKQSKPMYIKGKREGFFHRFSKARELSRDEPANAVILSHKFCSGRGNDERNALYKLYIFRTVHRTIHMWDRPTRCTLFPINLFQLYYPLLIFMCCWPCILVIFDFVFQLNALFFYYIFSSSSTCFEPYCAHHQGGLLCIWFFICHLRRVTYKEPDAVYMQWILLMMSTIWFETCRGSW